MTTAEPKQTSPPGMLFDRVSIVTGAGRGIGRGIALCLARAQADVVVVDQAQERIGAAVAEIEALGVKGLGFTADVSRAEDVEGVVQQTLEGFGSIGVRGNN